MKCTIVTQWVKLPPVQSLASRTVVNPAGQAGNGSPKPGGTRVQAAELSPEMSIVVDTRITTDRKGSSQSRRRQCSGRQQAAVRKGECRGLHRVEERGMHSQGKPGNLGEPAVSLSETPEEQGYRLTKSPGAGSPLPAVSEPHGGTQMEGADKVSGSERQVKRPETGRGQS
jgi:hypothetical protein